MENREFDNLNTYLNLAKKTINKFAGSLAKEMLKSEDAISDVANAIMVGDWRWDANRTGKTGQKKTRYSYRNQCAIWAIQTYATKKYKKPKRASIDFAKDEDSTQIKDTIVSSDKNIVDQLIDIEASENLNKDINYILNAGILSDRQVEYIKLYYFENYTLEKIGNRFNITREAVRQNIKKALKNIRDISYV